MVKVWKGGGIEIFFFKSGGWKYGGMKKICLNKIIYIFLLKNDV